MITRFYLPLLRTNVKHPKCGCHVTSLCQGLRRSAGSGGEDPENQVATYVPPTLRVLFLAVKYLINTFLSFFACAVKPAAFLLFFILFDFLLFPTIILTSLSFFGTFLHNNVGIVDVRGKIKFCTIFILK